MDQEGVQFQMNTEVGKDISAQTLIQNYDVLCITIGAEVPRDLKVPGRDLNGIHFAMEYLVQQNRRVSGKTEFWPEIHASSKRVIVIGGGDTGSDCVGTAHRQGCAEVSQMEILAKPSLERSEGAPWPLWPAQLRTSHAHEEGGIRLWGLSTTGFLGEKDRVVGIQGHQVRWQDGQMIPIPGSEWVMPADLVLLALGFQSPQKKGLVEELGLALDPRGNILTNAHYQTAVPHVFAAGDARRGASLIVWAIAEGRKMAAAVHQFLQEQPVPNRASNGSPNGNSKGSPNRSH
jgi:glutamate synthase (NADPH/NADH) small chain